MLFEFFADRVGEACLGRNLGYGTPLVVQRFSLHELPEIGIEGTEPLPIVVLFDDLAYWELDQPE